MERLVHRFEKAVRDRPAGGRAPARPPSVSPSRIGDPLLLARLHDAALFLRAFPRRDADVALAERILREVPPRMEALARAGADLSGLDDFAGVGIGGTSLTMEFLWGMSRWLLRRHGRDVSIAWDEVGSPARLAALLSRTLPFLSERSLADAGVGYEAWLSAALPRGRRDGGLALLVDAIDGRAENDDLRAERWDLLGVPVRWKLGASRASRTLARFPTGRLFVDPKPLLSRRDVSVAASLAPAPRVRRLDSRSGAAFLDAARGAVAVRYRELHAFTRGNPLDVVRGDLGRGLAIWCCGLLPEHRLPLRAGYGFLLVRNGIPVGYGDAYALGDRLDLSFNVFYAFRDGESAFAWARTVAFFRARFGTRSVLVDPYQIGRENEEAVESGAFWFYRKLGFRPADPELDALVRREEARILREPGRRTPPSLLRRFAGSPVLLDLPGKRALWRDVSVDGAGLGIQRRMAASGRLPEAFRRAARIRVARALDLGPGALSGPRVRAFDALAPFLDLVRGLSRLPAGEKKTLRALLAGKAGRSEAPSARALARARRLAATVASRFSILQSRRAIPPGRGMF